MPPALPKRTAELILQDILLPAWTAANTQGYDPIATDGTYLASATSIDDVGRPYPSLVVSPSQPGVASGQTTYDFMTANGPGQNRGGTVVATARVQDTTDGSGYTTDDESYPAVDAAELAEQIIDEVERICLANPTGRTTDLSYLGSHRPSDNPDDNNETPTVRLAQCTIQYGWLRTPPAP